MANELAFLELVKKGDTQGVSKMLDQQPELANARDADGLSIVLTAMYYGQPQIADLLIQHGARLDVFEAAATGQIGPLKAHLHRQPDLANATAADGFQPLGLASFFGHAEAVDLLLASGAQVNSASRNSQKVMPLHSAVAGGHLEIARSLLAHGAQVNARQQGGFTPLHGAAQNGQVELVELLLAHGANPNVKDDQGRTPLVFALEDDHAEVAALLRKHSLPG